jgi:hypothetical protein
MKPSSGLGPRDIALGKTIMEKRAITMAAMFTLPWLAEVITGVLIDHW